MSLTLTTEVGKIYELRLTSFGCWARALLLCRASVPFSFELVHFRSYFKLVGPLAADSLEPVLVQRGVL